MRNLFLSVLFFQVVCPIATMSQTSPHYSVIDVRIANLPSQRLYLLEGSSRKMIDSAEFKNGSYRFEILLDGVNPKRVSLAFINDDGRRILLSIKNTVLSSNTKEYGFTSFYLDPDSSIITGRLLEVHKVYPSTNNFELRGNAEQNEPLFLTQFVDFGFLDRNNALARKPRLDSFKNYIMKYPHSDFFLRMINSYKSLYTKEELFEIIPLFSGTARQSAIGINLQTYVFTNIPSGLSRNFMVSGMRNNQLQLFDTSKLNLIVFWASWCGPCRKEIPYLKKLKERFASSGLTMVSLSIDKDAFAWRKAMQEEKMSWQQLIASEKTASELMAYYHFDGIPFIMLLDKGGEILARFDEGYTGKPNLEMEKTIEKAIVRVKR